MRFLGGASPSGVEALGRALDYAEAYETHWREHGFGVWAVFEKEDARFIGRCGLRHKPEFDGIELLYAFEKAAWGRGYAREAGTAALDYGFNEAGLSEIIAFALPENTGSVAVMKKLGLRYLRHAPYYHAPYYHAPYYHAPYYHAPYYHAPYYHAPYYHAPYYHAPYYHAPYYHAPYYHAPYYHAPYYDVTVICYAIRIGDFVS